MSEVKAIGFDFDGALKAGASKKQILDYLASHESFASKFDELKANSADDEALFENLRSNLTAPSLNEANSTQTPTSSQIPQGTPAPTIGGIVPKSPLELENYQAPSTPNEKYQQALENVVKLDNELKNQDLWDISKEGAKALFGIETKGDKFYKNEIPQLNKIAFEAGLEYENLPQVHKDLLAKQKAITGSNADTVALFTGRNEELAKEQFNEDKKRYDKFSKPYDELTPEQQEDFKQNDLNFVERWLFDPKKEHKDQQEFYKAENFVNQKHIDDLIYLKENANSTASIFYTLAGDNQENKNRLYESLKAFKELNKLDAVYIDERNKNIYIEMDGQVFRVNDGFFDNFFTYLGANKFSITGGIAGTWAGLKKAKTPQQALAYSIAGAAAGSALGKGADVAMKDYRLGLDHNLREFVHLSAQEGLLSALGDGAVLGLSKAVSGVKPALRSAVKGVDYLSDTFVITGMGKNVVTQNISDATRLVNTNISKQEQSDILKTAKDFNAKLMDTNADESFTLNTKNQTLNNIVNSIFNPSASLTDRRRNLVTLIRGADDEYLSTFINQVSRNDAKANQNLKAILNGTTLQLHKQLENMGVNKSDIKIILDEMKTGNASTFSKMNDEVITKIYDDNYKTIIKPELFEKLKSTLEANGALDENSALFLKDIETLVFNPQGVSFTQLNNARSNLNHFATQAFKNGTPTSQQFFKGQLIQKLKDEIDEGIETIFKQNASAYEQVSKLYKTAVKEYGEIKNVLKEQAFKQAVKKDKSTDEVLDGLIKYAKAQGENGKNNLYALTAKLTPENKAVFEMNLLQRLYERNLAKSNSADLKVFNSRAFFDELESLASYEFSSKEAKTYLEILQQFHRLFKNDAKIAKEFGASTPRELRSGIATSVEGATKQKLTQGLMDFLFRNVPSRNLFIRKWEQGKQGIQGMALRYQILSALKKSNSMSEFKFNLQTSLSKSPFTSPAKELLEQLLKDLDDDTPPPSNPTPPNKPQGGSDDLNPAKAEFGDLSQGSQTNTLKGENFSTNNPSLNPAKSDLSVSISLDDWVKQLAGINPDKQIIADLEELYKKHPEIFTKPAEVFKLIKQVKDNPSFFLH